LFYFSYKSQVLAAAKSSEQWHLWLFQYFHRWTRFQRTFLSFQSFIWFYGWAFSNN